jgi:hypothetical protein
LEEPCQQRAIRAVEINPPQFVLNRHSYPGPTKAEFLGDSIRAPTPVIPRVEQAQDRPIDRRLEGRVQLSSFRYVASELVGHVARP